MENHNQTDIKMSIGIVTISLLSLIISIKGCGIFESEKKQPIVIDQPQVNQTRNCDGIAVGNERTKQCEAGYLGVITEQCVDKGDYVTWEVKDSTCRPPPSQCETDAGSKVTFVDDIKPLIEDKCIRCHGTEKFNEYGPAVSISDQAIELIQLGDDNPRRMPPPPNKPLEFEEVQLWQQWIDDGKLNDVECPDPDNQAQNFNSNEDFVKANLDAALALDGRGQLNARFVTCDTKYNYGATPEELENCRSAINDALNAVSDQPDLKLCSDTDAFNGSCRLDLESYGLTAKDWDRIVDAASLTFVDVTTEGLALQDVTGAKIPALTVDQFVEGAIDNSTNYYDFLGIPNDLIAYFDLKGVDIIQDIKDFRARFAGMSDSEVSARKNRLMVFLDSDDGKCSITFDPADAANEESNLAQFPTLVIGEKQFVFDASETICSMPNGGQEYALWNADGVRQDFAPTIIVIDYRGGPLHGDFEISNALDCFACHRSGWNNFDEEIRDAVLNNAGDFKADDLQIVRELYVTKAQLNGIMVSYNEPFRESRKFIGIDTLRPDPINRWQDEYRLPWNVDQLCGHIRLPLDQCIEDLATTSVAGDLTPILEGKTIARAVLDRIFDVIVDELRIGDDPVNGG